MQGLTIILIACDDASARAALTLAVSHAALGGRTRLYAHERAVEMLKWTGSDTTLSAAGLPNRGELLAMAIDAAVELIACQTGLALVGLSIDALTKGVTAGGLMGVLVDLGEDRLVTI